MAANESVDELLAGRPRGPSFGPVTPNPGRYTSGS